MKPGKWTFTMLLTRFTVIMAQDQASIEYCERAEQVSVFCQYQFTKVISSPRSGSGKLIPIIIVLSKMTIITTKSDRIISPYKQFIRCACRIRGVSSTRPKGERE